MTHASALSIAVFASLALGCSVDAPTRENFDYSFQEAMPEEMDGDHAPELTFTHSAYDTDFVVRFSDSHHGTTNVDPDVRSVGLVIESVQLQQLDADGQELSWVTVRDTPIEVDLMNLADGAVEKIAGGPISEGQYGAVAIEFSYAYVQESDGDVSELELPGMALYLEEGFRIYEGTRTDLGVRLGALRSLERDGDHWVSDPNVNMDVTEDL
ncbi:MAG: hypothetical protein ACE37F_27480 [Nannocystaceae bacterium]|nr:DUF4382 domain-containing protein [bacterium]